MTKNDKTLGAVEQIEALASIMESDKANRTPEQKKSDQLEEIDGIGWSSLVFEEIEWRLDQARLDLIKVAKDNSQYRSFVQVIFILLGALSVAMVWIKLDRVASKGML